MCILLICFCSCVHRNPAQAPDDIPITVMINKEYLLKHSYRREQDRAFANKSFRGSNPEFPVIESPEQILILPVVIAGVMVIAGTAELAESIITALDATDVYVTLLPYPKRKQQRLAWGENVLQLPVESLGQQVQVEIKWDGRIRGQSYEEFVVTPTMQIVLLVETEEDTVEPAFKPVRNKVPERR